jgi:hypothetical protein
VKPALQALEPRDCPAVLTAAGGRVVYDGTTYVAFPGDPARGIPDYTGQLSTAVGDFTGDGVLDLIVGAGPGGGPHVKVVDGRTGRRISEAANFFAFESSQRGGVVVGYDADRDLILVGAGPGGGPRLNSYDPHTFALVDSVFVGDPADRGGVGALLGSPYTVRVYDVVPDRTSRTPDTPAPDLPVYVNVRSSDMTAGQIVETVDLLGVYLGPVTDLVFVTRRPVSGPYLTVEIVDEIGPTTGFPFGDTEGIAVIGGALYRPPTPALVEPQTTAAATARVAAHEVQHLFGLTHRSKPGLLSNPHGGAEAVEWEPDEAARGNESRATAAR